MAYTSLYRISIYHPCLSIYPPSNRELLNIYDEQNTKQSIIGNTRVHQTHPQRRLQTPECSDMNRYKGALD